MGKCGESGGDSRRSARGPTGAPVPPQAPRAPAASARRRPAAGRAYAPAQRAQARTASKNRSASPEIWCSSETSAEGGATKAPPPSRAPAACSFPGSWTASSDAW